MKKLVASYCRLTFLSAVCFFLLLFLAMKIHIYDRLNADNVKLNVIQCKRIEFREDGTLLAQNCNNFALNF